MIQLTTEQQAVIESQGRHKVIEAVAGSGKSTLCVHQVAAWFDSGTAPEETAVITFTRRAAEAIKKKVRAASGAELGFAGTFHGMAYLCLAMACDGKYRLTPLTDEECDAVVDHVAASVRMTRSVTPKVRKIAKGEDVHKISDEERTLAVAILRYMTASRLVHVGLLVERFADALEMHSDLLDWFQARTRSLVVDEAQDMNDAEARIYRLACPSRSILVGDPRQSIYRFRGANPSHFVSLAHRQEAFTISYNFRSGSDILDVANRLWPPFKPKLIPFRTNAGAVESYPTTFDDTARQQIPRILAGMEGPVHVLCRYNRTVAMVDEGLRDAGIKSMIISPAFDRFSGPAWKRVFLACRIAMDPACDWLSTPARKLGLSADQFTRGDPAEMTAQNLVALYSAADMAELAGEEILELTVPQFIAWYQRRDLQDLMTDAKADVIVMTAHASKGLEFDTVLLCDVGRELGQERKTLEETLEEKNLLHVAITRARNRLILVGPAEYLSPLTENQ